MASTRPTSEPVTRYLTPHTAVAQLSFWFHCLIVHSNGQVLTLIYRQHRSVKSSRKNSGRNSFHFARNCIYMSLYSRVSIQAAHMNLTSRIAPQIASFIGTRRGTEGLVIYWLERIIVNVTTCFDNISTLLDKNISFPCVKCSASLKASS